MTGRHQGAELTSSLVEFEKMQRQDVSTRSTFEKCYFPERTWRKGEKDGEKKFVRVHYLLGPGGL